MNLAITKRETSIIKGIAILAMLVRHLYTRTDNP